MMSNEVTLPAQVLWAQRENLLYVTISLLDCKDPVINLDSEKLYFKGIGGTEKKPHEVTLNFYQKIKTEDSNHVVHDRTIDFVIIKEEKKWWPRLLKESKKYHWLKVDFNKWKDEDDSGDEKSKNFMYEDMVNSFDNKSNFNFGEGNDEFSDEESEELPELENEKDEKNKEEQNEKNEKDDKDEEK